MGFRQVVRAQFDGFVVPRFIGAGDGPDDSGHYEHGCPKDLGQCVISFASSFLLSSATYT
jgi:hypothetical protein